MERLQNMHATRNTNPTKPDTSPRVLRGEACETLLIKCFVEKFCAGLRQALDVEKRKNAI